MIASVYTWRVYICMLTLRGAADKLEKAQAEKRGKYCFGFCRRSGEDHMRKRTIWITAGVLVLAGGVLGTYTAIGAHYQTHFFENVTINGIDVSDLTAEEAQSLIAQQAEDFRITVTARDGSSEVIEGTDIGYKFVPGGEVQGFLEEQNPLNWAFAYMGEETDYTMEAAMTYDEQLLAKAVSGLSGIQEETVVVPEDAYVSKQEDGTYAIVPEVEGNQMDPEKVTALLKDAVENTTEQVDFAAASCYVEPAVRSDDAALKAEAAIMNRYSSMVITYQMGGGVTETLDWSVVADWFSLSEENQPVIDREAVAAWVNELADQYDTIGTWPEFVTSNGETVWPEARTYGWQMDRESETEELYQALLAGDSVERSPVWNESAGTRGVNDIGTTYIEIDYTNQRMWYYKDGVLLVETPVVTGNVSAGDASPEGIFCILYKEEDAVLRGEDYETPVDYWMPFFGGVGIHDADSWRSSYGGDIYQWGGSHGCINTPTAQARIIFENVEAGTPVVCYSSGINYGYGQIGSSSGETTETPGAEDIVIVDGGPNAGAEGDVIVENGAEAGADAGSDVAAEGSAGAGVGAGSDVAAEGSAGAGDQDSVVIGADNSYSEEQVIY